MKKKSKIDRRARKWEKTYELPRELDFNKLRIVGVGLESLEKDAIRRKGHLVVSLDADVAREYRTAEEVNQVLRMAMKIREIGKTTRRRKTA
jgi:hypothetical protein